MKNSAVDYMLWAVLGFIVLLSLFVTFVEPALDLPSMKDENLPDFSFEDVQMTQFDNGVQQWFISAKKADVISKKDLVLFSETSGNIFSVNGDEIIFDASTINYLIQDKQMNFEVASLNFLIGEKQFELFSNHLNWDYDRNQFLGSNGVKIKNEDVEILGDRFMADLPIEKLNVSTKVRARLKVNK